MEPVGLQCGDVRDNQTTSRCARELAPRDVLGRRAGTVPRATVEQGAASPSAWPRGPAAPVDPSLPSTGLAQPLTLPRGSGRQRSVIQPERSVICMWQDGSV